MKKTGKVKKENDRKTKIESYIYLERGEMIGKKNSLNDNE